jgi:hypothetical protein
VADDGPAADRYQRYYSRQQEFRVCHISHLQFNFILTLSSNIDAMFQKHRYLMFPSKSIHTDGIRAGVMVRILALDSLSN